MRFLFNRNSNNRSFYHPPPNQTHSIKQIKQINLTRSINPVLQRPHRQINQQALSIYRRNISNLSIMGLNKPTSGGCGCGR